MAITTLELVRIHAQTHEIIKRAGNGSLDAPSVRKALQAIIEGKLAPPSTPALSYTPVGEYVERIMARSKLRGWGLTKRHASDLSEQLKGLEHAGPFGPVGVRIWRGRDLAYNWAESIDWLQDEVTAQGLKYNQYFSSTPTFYPDSEINGSRSLKAAPLDLSLWDSKDGLVPNVVRPQQQCWPSLEVPDLLCLNPQLMHVMDGQKFPFLMAPGLVIDSDFVPVFFRRGHGFDGDYRWADGRWYDTAMVRSLEL